MKTYKSPLQISINKITSDSIINYMPSIINDNTIISANIREGAIEYALNQYGYKIIAFSENYTVVNYWKVQIANPIALFKVLAQYNATLQTFIEVKNKISEFIHEPVYYISEEESIKRAAYYFMYCIFLRDPEFSKLWLTSEHYAENELFLRYLKRVKAFRAKDFSVYNVAMKEVFFSFEKKMLYIEAPSTKNLPHDASVKDEVCKHHLKIRNLIYKRQGPFFMLYENHPVIKKWYSDYNIRYLPPKSSPMLLISNF